MPTLPELPPVYTRYLNGLRYNRVPVVNFVIGGVLAVFLTKLTFKYNDLYMKSSLITLIVTNLVLFGISETLAQSLVHYKPTNPHLQWQVVQETQVDDDVLVAEARPQGDEVDEFIEYLDAEGDGEVTPGLTPIPDLTYFSFSRLAGFMCWGFILAFAQCIWYRFLQIYSKEPKLIEVIRKVLTDQLCYSPVSLFCFFTYGTMILESGTWDDAKDKLKRVYLSTLATNYMVWFPVQFINFLIVPRTYQVPFSSSVSVLWNCFLSLKNSRS
ncbi:hypothetical protein DIURU_003996 [Diutina rugosa]|uniref:Uncharacterized protein n=1 Tax=Diutina rugosa TaxID=5481 RepID=A0A642UQW3_DIURU|nr:uncharacterized protein DIURU_003996 [Diutina rugosa]KAA8900048.1 hypothetical protein DIURU_003996 [Diutina rugosa]